MKQTTAIRILDVMNQLEFIGKLAEGGAEAGNNVELDLTTMLGLSTLMKNLARELGAIAEINEGV